MTKEPTYKPLYHFLGVGKMIAKQIAPCRCGRLDCKGLPFETLQFLWFRPEMKMDANGKQYPTHPVVLKMGYYRLYEGKRFAKMMGGIACCDN